MNSTRTLLILDDELSWLNRHKQYFQKHNYICIPMLFAEHAIDLGKELKSIKYAIIDAILFDPTQFEREGELQRHQGKDVLLKILETRSDIKFAIITKAISRQDTNESLRVFKGRLDGLTNVYYVFKDEFDIHSDEIYERIRINFFETEIKRIPRKSKKAKIKGEGNAPIKILTLAANPKDQSQSDLFTEVRDIEEGWHLAREREHFKFLHRWAVQVHDLQRALLDEEPKIVHFRGHGLKNEGLAFEDNSGQTHFASTDALANLFKLFAQTVECVILNACYSEPQAKAIVKHIDFVIGMRGSIKQAASREFSIGFYDALVRGESIERAFDFGRVAMDLGSMPETDVPILLRRKG